MPWPLGLMAQSCKQGSQTCTLGDCTLRDIPGWNSIFCVRRDPDAEVLGPDRSPKANPRQSSFQQIQSRPKRNKLLLISFGHSFFSPHAVWTKQFPQYLRVLATPRNTFATRLGQKKNACICGKPAGKTFPKAGLLWIVAIVIGCLENLGKIGEMGPMRKICRSLQFGVRQIGNVSLSLS